MESFQIKQRRGVFIDGSIALMHCQNIARGGEDHLFVVAIGFFDDFTDCPRRHDRVAQFVGQNIAQRTAQRFMLKQRRVEKLASIGSHSASARASDLMLFQTSSNSSNDITVPYDFAGSDNKKPPCGDLRQGGYATYRRSVAVFFVLARTGK